MRTRISFTTGLELCMLAPLLLWSTLGCGADSNNERHSAANQTAAQTPTERAARTMTEANLTRARGAADALVTGLMGELVQALEAGGPTAALAYCADSAQAITARFHEDGLVVRRVGTRLRNPGNTPNAREEAVLASFQRALDNGETPRDTTFVAVGPKGREDLCYFRPIVLGEPCLACHGDKAAMDPNLRATLAERYPEDRATGYRVGDLRGAISVRIRTDPAIKE